MIKCTLRIELSEYTKLTESLCVLCVLSGKKSLRALAPSWLTYSAKFNPKSIYTKD